MAWRCICTCVFQSRVRCSWQLLAGGEESYFLPGLWCRDSFPVVTVLERPGKGEKNHVLLNELPLFWLEASLITWGIVIVPIGIVWASDSSKFKRLPYFTNVFPGLLLRMTTVTWENITFQNKRVLIPLSLFSVIFVRQEHQLLHL